jgi:hypothetical protein
MTLLHRIWLLLGGAGRAISKFEKQNSLEELRDKFLRKSTENAGTNFGWF